MNYKAPPEARANAARGLALVDRGLGGKGLTDGTVDQARSIVKGAGLTYNEVRVNLAWFARFSKYTAAVQARLRDPECPAAVSWFLHGGDAGFDWVREIIENDPPLPTRGSAMNTRKRT